MGEEKRPVIGLTPDAGETSARAGRPSLPRYQLKQAYCDAVLAAGGVPIVLPYAADSSSISAMLVLCDGLVLTGGAFDIPPALYGEAAHAQLGALQPARTRFEQLLLREALQRDLPVLGVCGGMQLLAVELGGRLIQDLHSELPSALEHEQPNDPREPGHLVRIAAGSLLARSLNPGAGRAELLVNSTHHQAVRAPASAEGDGPARFRVSGLSPDGVVEAIEAPGRFVIGVQWHPELMAGEEPLALYRALVRAASKA